MKAKITNLEKERQQSDNTEFIKVEFDIVNDDGKVVAKKSIGMGKDSTAEDMEKEVKKHIDAYERETENKVKEEKKAKEEKNFIEAKEKLLDKEIDQQEDLKKEEDK